MKATEVTAGLAESNGSLLPGLWHGSLHVTCGLTACTPGSAPGPTLGNEYGKTLPFLLATVRHLLNVRQCRNVCRPSQNHPPFRRPSSRCGAQSARREQSAHLVVVVGGGGGGRSRHFAEARRRLTQITARCHVRRVDLANRLDRRTFDSVRRRAP